MLKIDDIIKSWKDEILPYIENGNAIFVACISNKGELLYTNQSLSYLKDDHLIDFFINPSLKYILSDEHNGNFFEGIITMGSIHSIDNISIMGKLFRKNDSVLLLGELDISELVEQNRIIRNLNIENSNLTRQLIQEKNALKISEASLLESQKQLQLSNATKDKFFSIIAHDLINPIGSFKEILSLMADSYEDFTEDERLSWIKRILAYSENSYNLLRNLLDWSRSQRGAIKVNITRIDIKPFISEVIRSKQINADKKSIQIENKVNSNVFVNADVNLLTTVIRNLISNAIKFTNFGGLITISDDIVGDKIMIRVADNGVGMSVFQLLNLFRIDQNISTEGTDKEMGTGLGLILCKEFIDKMKGEIYATSKQGEGTTFYITLPK